MNNVIINADDFGLSQSVNEAIKQSFQIGYINQTTIMANMPYFDEAVLISKKEGFFDKIGLHVTLDAGKPLTPEMLNNPHFVKNGTFIKGSFSKNHRKYHLSKYDRECVYKEIEAQINRYVKAGFPLKHFDSHHHVHINYSVIQILKELGLKYGFHSARIAIIRSNDSLLKKMYKLAINHYIKSAFKTTDVFLPYDSNSFQSKGTLELMTHPDIIDGKLVNVISRNPLKYEIIDSKI